jgi:phage-related protein
MSNNVGGANIDITADDRQARSTVRGFFGFLQGTGKIAAGVATGMAVFETINRGMQRLSGSTIGANASMEQYQNTLSIVLKDSKKAAETLAWAEKFAAQTPFEIPDVVEATVRLESYGLKAQEVLESTGNMAAVMGKPLMQAVEAVADAQTGELERLKEFGITKGMLIDKAAEMGKKEVVNAKGQITDMESFNEALFALMEDRYKGGMDVQSKTYKGLVSNVQDSVGTIMRILSQPIFEKLKSGLESAVPVLSAFTSLVKGDTEGALNTLYEAFGAERAFEILNFFDGFKKGIDNAKQAISPFIQFLKAIFEIFKGNENSGSKILESLGLSASQVQSIINAINLIQAYINLFVETTVARVQLIGQFFIDAWKIVWPYLQPLLTKIVKFVGEKIQQIIDFWDKEGAQILQAVKNIFNGILAVIKFIMPAVMVIVEMVWTNIKGVIDGALKIIMGLLKVFTGIFTGDFSKMWEGIKQLFVGAVQFLWNLINLLMLGRILGAIKSLATKGISLFTGFWSKTVGIFKNLDTQLVNIISGAVTKVLGFFKNLYTQGSQIFGTLRTFGASVFQALWTAIKTVVVRMVTGIVNYYKGMFTGIKFVFQGIFSTAKTIFLKIKDVIQNPLKSINLTTIGKDIINGLIKGITAMGGAVKEKIEELTSNIPSWAKKVLGIHSPSKEMDEQVGQHIPTGIAQGINKTSKEAQKAAEKAANDAAKAAKAAATKNKKDFQTAFTGLDYKFDAGQLSVAEYIKALEELKKKYASVPNAISRIDKTLVEVKKKHAKELFEIDRAAYENKIKFGQLSWKQEIKLLEQLAKKYKKGSEERAYFEEQIYYIKKDIHDKLTDLNQDYAQRTKEISEKLREDERRAEEDFKEKVVKIKEKLAEDKAKALENYEAKVKEVNERLISEEKRLNDEYEKALDDRRKSLYSFAGLFDEINKKDVTGTSLLTNLSDQVNTFRQWQSNIANLAQRGISQGLLKELQDMGPQAADEIAALTTLSDAELQQYTILWAEKHRLAAEAATKELEGLKNETQTKIQQLRHAARTELALLRFEYNNELKELTSAANAEIAKHKLEFETEVKNLRVAANKELTQMKTEWVSKIKELTGDTKKEFDVMKADMNAIGKDAVKGLLAGMKEMEGPLKVQAQAIADAVSSTIKKALEIRSPSRVLKRLGVFVPEGLAKGMEENVGSVIEAAKQLALASVPNLPFMANTIGSAPNFLKGNGNILTVKNVIPSLENKIDKLVGLFEQFIKLANSEGTTIKVDVHDNHFADGYDAGKKIESALRRLLGS